MQYHGNGRWLDDLAKIKLLVKENPKRKGSKARRRFERYQNGLTVGQAIERGLTRADVRYDFEHKLIDLAKEKK